MGQDTEIRRLRGFGDTTVALVARGMTDEALGDGAAAPLPEAVMTFESQGDGGTRWQVRHFEVTEGLSALYECAIDLAAGDLSENPDTLLGRYALLQVQRDTVVRRFYGLVRRVEHRGTTATHRLARVYTVPALFTLSQRSDARIYQGMTAIEVVQAVLQEAGLYAGMLDLRLQRRYPAREYCVQYRETDLAFVRRLLESEGVAFFFRHDEESETLVLADGPHAYESARTMDGGPIPIAGAEGRTHRVETVRRLTWEREQRPTGVVVRDFDFTRPDYRIERMAPRRREGDRNLYEPAPALTLGQYAGAMYTQENGQDQALLRLEAERAGAAVGTGEGVVVGLSPGALFQLTLAGSYVPEQRYLVTEVTHTGDAPEVFAIDATERVTDEDRYRNRFRCVPVEVPFRPERATPRPVIAGLQTALVTGPAGEEIYTDEHGRIKVQFHWDRIGTRDEHTTAWLRVMQGPWAGNGWGFQFLPRVGMEVAVSFLEGDPDRPVILGALYNGQNRPPYSLPEDKSRSAIKSQTTPGGNGYNELRFEDAAGREEVFIHAQRDLNTVVEHDHTLNVGRDRTVIVGAGDTHRVGGHRSVEVTGDDAEQVRGDRRVTVHGHATTSVEGQRHVNVHGSGSTLVGHDHTLSVTGRYHLGVLGQHPEGSPGSEEAPAYTVQVLGSHALVASRSITVQAGDEITLFCGRSSITLTDEEVRVTGPRIVLAGQDEVVVQGAAARVALDGDVSARGDRVDLRAQGAEVELTSTATVRGSRVCLANGGGASDQVSNESPSTESHRITVWVNVGSNARRARGELVVRDAAGADARVFPESAASSQGEHALAFELEASEMPRPMTVVWRVAGAVRTLFGPVDPVAWYERQRAERT